MGASLKEIMDDITAMRNPKKLQYEYRQEVFE
jgi:hypothetical protein